MIFSHVVATCVSNLLSHNSIYVGPHQSQVLVNLCLEKGKCEEVNTGEKGIHFPVVVYRLEGALVLIYTSVLFLQRTNISPSIKVAFLDPLLSTWVRLQLTSPIIIMSV